MTSETTAFLPLHLASLLPFELTSPEQVMLADGALEHGTFIDLPHVGAAGWISLPVRRPLDPSLNGFVHRMMPGIEWDWFPTPVTDLAREVVRRVEPLFTTLTRVTLLLQNTGHAIAMHRDPVHGNEYGGQQYFVSPHVQMPAHRSHQSNGFISIKAPISTREGNNGCPVVQLDDGSEWQYDVGRNFFAINEVELLHGARPCRHHRGVMWLDGWLDMDVFRSLRLTPVPIRTIGGTSVSMPWGSGTWKPVRSE